jgi:hypothetical protein
MNRLIIAIFTLWPAWGQDPVDIIRRSLDRDISNFEHLKDYTYQEHEQDRQFDNAGKLKKTESETNEVMILGGRPYERLIARNDKPLSAKEAAKEQEKLDQEVARHQNLSAAEKARLEKRRAENRKFLREIPEAFSFRLVGEENISGKPAWIITADPKPDFHPKDIRAKILSKMRGKIWVDKGEYQWVKVEAEVLDTISVGMALFRVAPGGSISFEQARVNDEVWLPAHIHVRADARVAYLKKMHAEVEVNYRDYKKFQSDSRIVATDDK